MAKMCPLLKSDCVEHGCKFYVHLIGNNPQTGVPEDRFDCTFAFLPVLLIENSQMQRQTHAELNKFRNEIEMGANMLLASAAQRRLGGGTTQ